MAATMVPESIVRLAARLGGEPSVRRVILFGSRGRGDARPRADVDLAVEAPRASPGDWLRLLAMAEDAETLLPIDLVRVEEAPAELLERIRVEGRTLLSDSEETRALLALGRALDRLGEALAQPEDNPLAIDGTIQRFEFAMELYWKALRRLLLREGVATTTPREALQQAFRAGWLDDETAWLQMLRDRNETSHTYNEKTARRVYTSIRAGFPEMARTYARLRAQFPA